MLVLDQLEQRGLHLLDLRDLGQDELPVLAGRFDPADSLATMAESKVTVVIGAPGMFAAWLAHPDFRRGFATVRFALSGSAPLAPALWRGGISTAGALLLAAFSLARRRLFRRQRWENAFATAMHPLRRLHSGLIGDYVAWLTFGVAAFGVLCFWLIR